MDAHIKVLMIEDDPAYARLAQSILACAEIARFDVEVVDRLKTGLQKLKRGGVDVVLLDLNLPDCDGLDSLAKVLAIAPSVAVVVVTGAHGEMLGVEAAHRGAQDYLIKTQGERVILARALRYAIERKRVEEERRELIVELEAFAHTVAHGLKNPLAAVITFTQLATTGFGKLPEERILHYLQMIEQSGHKMHSVITELLLFASVREKGHVQVERLEMARIMTEVQERLFDLVNQSRAEITFHNSPKSWPIVLGYAPWVEEVWANYLCNALKYGGQPPHVEIGAERQESDAVRFWVRDNGPGIAPEDLSKLFAPFTRLGYSQTEGSGLGLSIVRRIVKRLGGEVGVESELGKGSVFSFVLPTAD